METTGAGETHTHKHTNTNSQTQTQTHKHTHTHTYTDTQTNQSLGSLDTLQLAGAHDGLSSLHGSVFACSAVAAALHVLNALVVAAGIIFLLATSACCHACKQRLLQAWVACVTGARSRVRARMFGPGTHALCLRLHRCLCARLCVCLLVCLCLCLSLLVQRVSPRDLTYPPHALPQLNTGDVLASRCIVRIESVAALVFFCLEGGIRQGCKG